MKGITPWDSNLPRGPALLGLSWDGGVASKRRSYTPIIVSVGNTDSTSCETCICIGYLPQLPDGTDSDVRRLLVQRCIGAITKVLDDHAKKGFTCILKDTDGQRRLWHLYPVLARVELDTKERYKFFGCARQHACGIGSGPRRGRSCLRACTPHSSRTDIEEKRRLVAVGGAAGVAAEKSLKRRGRHSKIRCPAITDHCKHATLPIPGRLFRGLFAYDILHVVYIGAIGYCLETVVDLLTPSQKKRLDTISARFCPFRDRHWKKYQTHYQSYPTGLLDRGTKSGRPFHNGACNRTPGGVIPGTRTVRCVNVHQFHANYMFCHSRQTTFF